MYASTTADLQSDCLKNKFVPRPVSPELFGSRAEAALPLLAGIVGLADGADVAAADALPAGPALHVAVEHLAADGEHLGAGGLQVGKQDVAQRVVGILGAVEVEEVLAPLHQGAVDGKGLERFFTH